MIILIFFLKYYRFVKNYESYYTENTYLLNIKELSSELTLGIGIYNFNQFKQFLEDIKWFSDNFKEKCIITLSKE